MNGFIVWERLCIVDQYLRKTVSFLLRRRSILLQVVGLSTGFSRSFIFVRLLSVMLEGVLVIFLELWLLGISFSLQRWVLDFDLDKLLLLLSSLTLFSLELWT